MQQYLKDGGSTCKIQQLENLTQYAINLEHKKKTKYRYLDSNKWQNYDTNVSVPV